MRLAILGDYPRDISRIGGGVEAVIAYLVQGLRHFADLDIHIVTLREGIDRERVVQKDGITVHSIPAAYRLANLTFFIRNKLRLRRVLRSIQPDLIHAHIAGMYSQVAFSMGCPAVLTPHGIRHRETSLKKGWLNQIVRYPLTRYDERVGIQVARHIISISPYIEQEFRTEIRGKVYPIENPTSESYFNLRGQERPYRLLLAGHISPRKGVFHLVQAVARLRERFPEIELHVAGPVVSGYDPAYYPAMQAFISEHALQQQVQFTGRLDETALLQEYAACAIFALPSKQETAPMVIEQAMAAGKPVVATRVGGIPQLVAQGQTGLLVEHGDVAGLTEALARLLSDPVLRTRMGKQGKEAACQRFRAEIVARQTYEVYCEILRERAGE
ncbi:MAG TPA: glycosyltransferase family 4 protein [Anaerolineae bacterium]|nr:glycosyltransferase family 4 protein [Anaerolineae bacterium]